MLYNGQNATAKIVFRIAGTRALLVEDASTDAKGPPGLVIFLFRPHIQATRQFVWRFSQNTKFKVRTTFAK